MNKKKLSFMLTGIGLTGILTLSSAFSISNLNQPKTTNHQMQLAVLNQETAIETKHNLNDLPVMKLLNFRSTTQIKEQLPELIVKSWNSSSNGEPSWSLKDLPNFEEDLNLLDPKFDGQNVYFIVNSKPTSNRVSGSLVFEFKNQKIDLSNLNQEGHLALSQDNEKDLKNFKVELLRKIGSQLQREGFMNDPAFSNENSFDQFDLKFSHESYYPIKKDGKAYLKNFEVEVTSKTYSDLKSFLSPIKFTNVQAPIYNTGDVFLNPNTDAFGAYTDSQSKGDVNDTYQKALFNVTWENSVAYAHTTRANNWLMNDPYLITTIDYQKLFNYNDVETFLRHYNLSYQYTYKMNALSQKGWVDAKGLSVKTGSYDNVITLNNLNQERIPDVQGSAKTPQFQNIIGSVRYGATAGASVYAINKPEHHKIYIYAQTGVWTPRKTHGNHLAAFAAITDTNVTLIPRQ